jgi:hypothetical protein
VLLAALKTFIPSDAYRFWTRLGKILPQSRRPELMNLMPSLTSLLSQLGGKSGLEKMSQAIIDVSEWWP